MKIKRDVSKNEILLTQETYCQKVLERFEMVDCHPSATSLEPETKLAKSDQCDYLPYQSLIGSLNYLAVATRPDIAHAVSFLSQFNTCFNHTHYNAAKRVLRYLKGTVSLGLCFKKVAHPRLVCYSDSDWANCPVDRRSYTGFVTLYAGTAISWESRKQRTVALSSTVAEYMALSDCTKEALYMSRLLKELCDETSVTEIFCDNRGAIELSINPVYRKRTKHIHTRYHFIRECAVDKRVKFSYCCTAEMPADVLTNCKSLPKIKHEFCTKFLGVK